VRQVFSAILQKFANYVHFFHYLRKNFVHIAILF